MTTPTSAARRGGEGRGGAGGGARKAGAKIFLPAFPFPVPHSPFPARIGDRPHDRP